MSVQFHQQTHHSQSSYFLLVVCAHHQWLIAPLVGPAQQFENHWLSASLFSGHEGLCIISRSA